MREFLKENWRAVQLPHGYNDGTTHRWAVRATGRDPAGTEVTIEIADWSSRDAANLIAAAPELYAALESLVTEIEYLAEGRHSATLKRAHAALAKARGDQP